MDLACGELEPQAETDARAHLQGCAECRADFERLRAGLRAAGELSLEPAPAAVSARLLALAEQHARAAGSAPARPGPWRRLLELASRIATARQVGMVTVSALIALLALVTLPEIRQATRGGRSAERVVAPVTPGAPAAAPASATQPAAPPLAEEEAKKAAAEPPAAPAPALQARAERSAAAPHRAAHASSAKRARTPAESAYAGAPPPQAGAANEGRAYASGAAPAKAAAKAAATPPASNAGGGPSAAIAATPRAFPEPRADDALAEPGEGALAVPAASAPAAERAEAAPAAPAARAQSLLDSARSVSSKQGCAAASSLYRRVVDAAPASREAGTALIALAQCARAQGRESDARALLERAARIPAVSARARSLLPPAQK